MKDKTKTIADLISITSQLYMNRMIQTVNQSLFGMPKITGYRNVKVPVYLKIKIPVIEKDYDNDSEYGTGEFRGYLISFREIDLFKIGTKIEKQPIFKKEKGSTIRISRYSPLEVKK